VTQLTQSGGIGFPRPYNDADFARDFLGVPLGRRTQSGGIGFARPFNASDFARDPTDPGGDFIPVSSVFTGAVAGTFEPIDGFDVVVGMYGGVVGSLTVGDDFFVLRADVDDIDLELGPIGDIDVEWM
jgi:hypothetical protein